MEQIMPCKVSQGHTGHGMPCQVSQCHKKHGIPYEAYHIFLSYISYWTQYAN